MPSNNKIVVASAGSGKTTFLTQTACAQNKSKAALITYTNNGRDELEAKTYENIGHLPPNITIDTWFSFLLRHFVRPYQRVIYEPRVNDVHFVNTLSARYAPATDIDRHYFSRPGTIFSDKISKFACEIIQRTDGAPLTRLSEIFDNMYIDESQDLAGYDLDLVELLLQSPINTTLVADYRQATYSTHPAKRNKQYQGANIVRKFREWEEGNLCRIVEHNHSYRCVQKICDFADRFHPTAPQTKSRNNKTTDHDGVFAVRQRDVEKYVARFAPQTLRYSRAKRNVIGQPLTYGSSKGKTFNRTLIYPHGPLEKYLKTNDIEDAGKELAKIYVAVTRARQSVAFVVKDNANLAELEIFEP